MDDVVSVKARREKKRVESEQQTIGRDEVNIPFFLLLLLLLRGVVNSVPFSHRRGVYTDSD